MNKKQKDKMEMEDRISKVKERILEYISQSKELETKFIEMSYTSDESSADEFVITLWSDGEISFDLGQRKNMYPIDIWDKIDLVIEIE
ncbi:MAG: hypothetical protein QXH07_01345, partial [Thermoplasmata archaeon]